MSPRPLLLALLIPALPDVVVADPPVAVSGIYPHLAMFNEEAECGTGAVVPWADRLWVITYGPHLPFGSSDRLYEITVDLEQSVRPESVGGTHANRMIHRESQQLFIGPYVIDAMRNVRVIPPRRMPGRLTGNARHLTEPARKVYFATMEEGLYEVDVRTLDVTGLIRDGNAARPGQTDETHPATVTSGLPGYHGKGLYSGQGRVVYSNNGEQGDAARIDPATPSGALAEWRNPGEDWQLLRRNQFTEVTGPGGVHGNEHPGTDPIWSIGWDVRSLILMCLDSGVWCAYRLPKASHCYDGAHGWNTEWPRIREIGEPDLLMTMHGAFWRFPRTFSAANSSGIAPRSTYLKVVGDFCLWNGRVVFGCDDTAKNEFLNKRPAKGNLAGPARSHSNLWFVDPSRLDALGPVLGRGAVWLDDDVKADTPSDPFLFSGYMHRALHLAHRSSRPVTFTIEVDSAGNGVWRNLREVTVDAGGSAWTEFSTGETGAWVRVVPDHDCLKATAFFHYRNADRRSDEPSESLAGLARPGATNVGASLLHAGGGPSPTLSCVVADPSGEWVAYELDATLQLRRQPDPQRVAWVRTKLAISRSVLAVDEASVLYMDDKGRWRLPKGDPAFDETVDGRLCREVCTERDLFNAHGTFYELPAENAGGFARIRPIATHNRLIRDYASYRGLLVMSGVPAGATGPHIVRAQDGPCALWIGAVDDLWQLGKPRGVGGPWCNTAVSAGQASDPYLMTGYDQKSLALSHDSPDPVLFRVEVDITGTGHWVVYRDFRVPPGKGVQHQFPDAFAAYWVRLIADHDCNASARFQYK